MANSDNPITTTTTTTNPDGSVTKTTLKLYDELMQEYVDYTGRWRIVKINETPVLQIEVFQLENALLRPVNSLWDIVMTEFKLFIKKYFNKKLKLSKVHARVWWTDEGMLKAATITKYPIQACTKIDTEENSNV